MNWEITVSPAHLFDRQGRVSTCAKMGGIVGKQMKEVMEENMKKQQEFMLASQRMQVVRSL